jgi:ubiquinone/menaquinone biosynthesis C-methylase UbiE
MNSHKIYRQDIDDEISVFDRIAEENLKVKRAPSSYFALYEKIGINPCRKKKKKLLEIGCGEGVHCLLFEKMGYEVTGIDISKKAIKKALQAKADSASNKSRKLNFYIMKAQKMEFEDNFFDCVVFWNTLHHFYYSGFNAVLKETIRVTKEGGYLFICEPNDLHPYNFIAFTVAHFLKKYLNIPYIEKFYTINEHSLNPYKIMKTLRKELKFVSLSFFSYMFDVADQSPCKKPLLITLARNLFRSTVCFLPEKYRHDQFSLKFQK